MTSQKRKIVYLTGVLTDEECIKDIEALQEKQESKKIKGKPYRHTITGRTALGEQERTNEACSSLSDVDDYAYLDDDPDAIVDAVDADSTKEETANHETKKRKHGRPKKSQEVTVNSCTILGWLRSQKHEVIACRDTPVLEGSEERRVQVGVDQPKRPRGKPKKSGAISSSGPREQEKRMCGRPRKVRRSRTAICLTLSLTLSQK